MPAYVYIQTEPSLWTVGHYNEDKKWFPESDHGSPGEAADRVSRLNGGNGMADLDRVKREAAKEPSADELAGMLGTAMDRWPDAFDGGSRDEVSHIIHILDGIGDDEGI